MKINIFHSFLFLLSFFLISCRDKGSNYYVVDKIRTPTAQVYSQTTQTGQGCINVFNDGDTWCQQFPMRPAGTVNAAAGGKIKLNFLALAPSGNPVTLALTSLKIFDLSLLNNSSGNGTRGVDSSTPATTIPLSDFSFNLNTSLSNTVQTSPLQIQTIVYDLTVPSLSTLITYGKTVQAFPGFILSYSSSSPNLSYVDKGYLAFYILPDPTDTISWSILNSSFSNFVNGTKLTQAFALSHLNTPIQISSLTPSSNSTIAAQSDNNVAGQLTYNPSSSSYSSVQWYVSSGGMNNDRAVSTTWNPQQSGNATAVFIARDLLGGMDYKISNFVAQ